MNISELLQRPIMGMPLWLWAGVVGGGGIVLAIYLKRRGGSSSSGALGQNTQPQAIDPNIDPYTGVPYTIESQINPNTGLPAYYGGPGVDQGSTGSPNPTPAPPPAQTWSPGPTSAQFPGEQIQATPQAFNPGPSSPVVQFPPRSGGARGLPLGTYQATPWWPAMTDLDNLAHGREG